VLRGKCLLKRLRSNKTNAAPGRSPLQRLQFYTDCLPGSTSR